ncbi:hypothetical protein M011DRAFT_413880 [Sporormia fimetaria CBS 119925]|uniref:EthD domain-containing protein n=1 Tax=Sporormia fimetaria CBS 119925 TaxID=1340428 RepID=A0A6A6UXF6_9PLEO|nr:hypothetical protein M011DRAFT_413880 [Sporormia fimetaria CBS 119925]
MDNTNAPPPCPNHYTHQYTFPEVALGSGSNEQPYFRAQIFFNKKPDVTEEFFHEHWKTVHADLTIQTKASNVLLTRYTQLHMDKASRDALEPLFEAGGGLMHPMNYDGAAEFYARSAEDFTTFIKNVWASDNLTGVLTRTGCGKRFADVVTGYQVFGGYENLIMGSAIPGLGGKDGIALNDSRFVNDTSDDKAGSLAQNSGV